MVNSSLTDPGYVSEGGHKHQLVNFLKMNSQQLSNKLKCVLVLILLAVSTKPCKSLQTNKLIAASLPLMFQACLICILSSHHSIDITSSHIIIITMSLIKNPLSRVSDLFKCHFKIFTSLSLFHLDVFCWCELLLKSLCLTAFIVVPHFVITILRSDL